MTAATARVPVSSPASLRSVSSLVLGILGLAACGIFSPFAWYYGWRELADIRLRRASESGEAVAKVGYVLGIVGTVVMAPVILLAALVALALIVAFWVVLFTA